METPTSGKPSYQVGIITPLKYDVVTNVPSAALRPNIRTTSTAKNKGKKWKSWEDIFCFVFMCGQNPKIAEYHNSIM